ncbi:MAG: type II secretion system protein [Kiritimatiellia bacterium]|nr:type II secretion system protein [Kiritimatiellia bacterium]
MRKSSHAIRRFSRLHPFLPRWALGVGRSAFFLLPRSPSSSGFTLIELMVVIAVIGILIGGVFKLLSTAGTSSQRAETVARLERLQNAISGFYAEFGTYPPVPRHGSPDPFMEADENGGTYSPSAAITSANANRAARCQPVAFYYPNARSLDYYINERHQSAGIVSVNDAFGPDVRNRNDYEWDQIKLFQFGLMSYLMPRIELMLNGSELDNLSENDENIPNAFFFDTLQWTRYNAGSKTSATSGGWWGKLRENLGAQRDRENHAVARWLPNLEKNVCGGPGDLLGINTTEPNTGLSMVTVTDPDGGVKYMLMRVSIRDGWEEDLYYYSAAPYQSYRLWSAGPDKKTFPPWISLESLSESDRRTVSEWLKDDIARFDRSK